MQASISSFKTSDNLSLEVQNYLYQEEPEKILLIIHGLGDHAVRYQHVAEYFGKEGYSSAVLTLRGHGKSDGKRGHAPSMEQLVLDVEYFVRQIRCNHIDARLYLYGHSMGGNIILNYLLKDQSSEINAGIVTSPWIKLAFEPPKWKTVVGNIMADIIPTLTQSNGLDVNEISSIPEEVEKYARDPLNHNKISAKMFKVITKGGENILSKADKFHHPIFLAHGSADKVTDAATTQELSARNDLFSWHSYEGNKHEIHNDNAFHQLMEDIGKWLKDK
ncbi:lysophospholipase [Marivirga sp. S37H4]|uniref:Lysophospholipase n=1 Tax=Marivirga aurantiaca TaxID=2802615 RepID=A0A935C769_9BACT|nr:alpha/beta hydrolase [Marivirga aurantiaca]MBK6264744.1 lysophospholipase [Marivirga aurantiaca]